MPVTSSIDARIVGLGVVVVDLLAVVDAYPTVDTKQDVADSLVQVGGPVPTALAQLTKFGHRCRYVGCWGDDPFGDVVEADFDQTGIAFDVDSRQDGVTTGHSQVWIERVTGTRTSVTQRPNVERFELSDADRAALARAEILHLDGWQSETALEAATIVKQAGGRIVLDTGSPKPGIERLLAIADVVNAPQRFIADFLDEPDLIRGAIALGERGASIVTVTDGERGAVMRVDGQVLRIEAPRLSTVVDTNGAGDVFTAGLSHGLLSDWPFDRILRFAAATAGVMCESLGNRESLPSDREAQAVADTMVVIA